MIFFSTKKASAQSCPNGLPWYELFSESIRFSIKNEDRIMKTVPLVQGLDSLNIQKLGPGDVTKASLLRRGVGASRAQCCKT